MALSSLHFLLTYECTAECDRCFVFGGPNARDDLALKNLRHLLDEGERLGTVESVYFEGGEPFLRYDLLLAGVREARERGWNVGVVTNGFWATSWEAAAEKLKPLAELGLADFTVSDDQLHDNISLAATARAAARELGMPVTTIHTEPGCQGGVMYRGRAAEKLAAQVPPQHWSTFNRCPHEQLDNPDRVHLDGQGWVHLCQGLVMGNGLMTPLADLVRDYDPARHPVVGPLLRGGPAELAREFGVPEQET